ncbi:MAG: polyprenyl synthetase family protein [Fidelibacterota bacterium]
MRQFSEKIEKYRKIINEKLLTVTNRTYPESLYVPIQYVLSGSGKRIRPLILILSCEATGGTIESCIDAAVSVEILHNFTLVHDDIMDNDDWRRGKPTIHKRWNESVAILSGDGLLILAYQSLLRTKVDKLEHILNIFTRAIMDVCEGQAMDKEFEERDDVTTNEYMHMIEKKTARLISVSAEMGALISGADDDTVKACRDFGFDMGKAFQIQDDMFEIISDRETMGKSLGSDLADGKKTFLLINALHKAGESENREINAILSGAHIGENEVSRIREIFERLNIFELTKKEIEKNIILAKSRLDALPEKRRLDLISFSDYILNRTN